MILPPLCWRIKIEAYLVQVKVPFRWTAITSSPLLLGHVEDHAVSEDSRHADQNVYLAEFIYTRLDDVLATLHGGNRFVVGDGVATGWP